MGCTCVEDKHEDHEYIGIRGCLKDLENAKSYLQGVRDAAYSFSESYEPDKALENTVEMLEQLRLRMEAVIESNYITPTVPWDDKRTYVRTCTSAKALLEAEGVSPEDFSLYTGLSASEARSIYLGYTDPSLSDYRHVADVLNISLDQLFAKLYRFVPVKDADES